MPARTRLDKEQVVQAAVELINEKGVEALTLKRLAQRLGIRSPSLYNHIDGLPDLQRELARENARRLERRFADAAIAKTGAGAMQALAVAYREYILENRGLYMASLRASRNREPVDLELQRLEGRVVEIALAVVASFGYQGDDGLHVVRGLRSLVHGFASLEIAGGFGLSLDKDESFDRLVKAYILGLQSKEGKS
jgi:AcrR family transcriptional regulator